MRMNWKSAFIMSGILTITSLSIAVDIVGYDLGNHVLIRWTLDGSVVWQNASIAHDSYQLEVGPDGYLYLGAWLDDRVYRIDPATGYPDPIALQQVSITDRTWDITFGNDIDGDGTADLWVAAGHNGAGDGYILAYGSVSGYAGSSEQAWIIADVTRRVVALDFGPDVSGDGINDLWIVDGDNNDSGNQMLVLDGQSGATLNSWSLSSLRGPKDVEVEGDRVYVTSSNAHDIYSFALDGTDSVRVVIGTDSPEYYPRQIHLNAEGKWYTANRYSGDWGGQQGGITVFDSDWTNPGVYYTAVGTDFTSVVTIQKDPCPDPSIADLTGDCVVDMDDLLIMISEWLMDTDPAN